MTLHNLYPHMTHDEFVYRHYGIGSHLQKSSIVMCNSKFIELELKRFA